MDPKSDQNGIKNHKDNGFVRFLGVLEETVFSRFLETKKIGPKSGKIWKKNQQRATDPGKITRPGGMRGASGELKTFPIRQIPCKNSNLRIFSLEFQDFEKTLSLEFKVWNFKFGILSLVF